VKAVRKRSGSVTPMADPSWLFNSHFPDGHSGYGPIFTSALFYQIVTERMTVKESKLFFSSDAYTVMAKLLA